MSTPPTAIRVVVNILPGSEEGRLRIWEGAWPLGSHPLCEGKHTDATLVELSDDSAEARQRFYFSSTTLHADEEGRLTLWLLHEGDSREHLQRLLAGLGFKEITK